MSCSWSLIRAGSILPRRSSRSSRALRASETDLAIAVPQHQSGRSAGQLAGQEVPGAGRASSSLGTSDAFSGLMAIRRSHLSMFPTVHQAARLTTGSGSAGVALRDTRRRARSNLPDDRPILGLPRLDDVRQLKRLLDHRFGTFSRLVQFCMVGASGMIVDLTFYALFQCAFRPLRVGSRAVHPGSQFSWHLAAARALAILVALVWNFTLNRRLTFNDSRSGSIPRQFLTYALGNALGIAVSMTLSLWLPMQREILRPSQADRGRGGHHRRHGHQLLDVALGRLHPAGPRSIAREHAAVPVG